MPNELARHIALIPGVCAVAVFASYPKGGKVRAIANPFFLVGIGLFVSWWGDTVANFMHGSLGPSYVWLPVQIWLVLIAFILTPLNRFMLAGLVVLLAFISWNLTGSRPDGPGPDFLLTLFAFFAVLFLAKGPLAFPLFIYFGIGTAAYVLMMTGAHTAIERTFYHSCRLLAYISFIVIIAPPLIKRKRGTI